MIIKVDPNNATHRASRIDVPAGFSHLFYLHYKQGDRPPVKGEVTLNGVASHTFNGTFLLSADITLQATAIFTNLDAEVTHAAGITLASVTSLLAQAQVVHSGDLVLTGAAFIQATGVTAHERRRAANGIREHVVAEAADTDPTQTSGMAGEVLTRRELAEKLGVSESRLRYSPGPRLNRKMRRKIGRLRRKAKG